MCLVVVILVAVEDTPLADWKHDISPNSLIAICTTVGRAALMVPIASCLGQLKWRHIRRRPQKLVHLQLFDAASRGPWGALVMLTTMRARAIVGWLLAVVTIVAMGIEPSAQQVLDFQPGTTQIQGESVAMSRSHNYTSLAFPVSGMYSAPLLAHMVGVSFRVGRPS
jgi:hypothetical protein